ncbi:beta-glucosidase [Jannaschia pagri]|uniref:Beta-glucosidase n=1 Tax=Jannaschia pagri TaxID=2829797 RepID=A0ABQ4NNA9_9RHOB|nr:MULTISPECIES: GH1 family beta-glucosidase [unclassified Jannaschia]GIT92067.1 beta-glucosidase [Jannaschia sp. AI_61]GIT95902.1 beta-glucosidase [Jannaschia sp. AI_62]
MTRSDLRDALSVTRSDFPSDFQFAVATSAYQIEGHAHGGAGPTHWDAFARVPGKVDRGEDGALACDHFHRWAEDLDLIAEAGFDAYRFSTSWARIMPDGRQLNEAGLDFYDRLVDGMLERGIKPMATLYHWELPQALSERGGWTSREIPERFAEFSARVARRLGDRLWSTAPVNEPWCVAWLSHFHGYHAPGLADLTAAARAMHHVGLAHGLSIQALRAEGVPNLGAACNMEYALPATDRDADRQAADIYDGIYNRWFVGGMVKGIYPEDIVDGLSDHLPDGWQNDLKIISEPIDWMGINYYTCKRIARANAPWPAYTEREGPLPKTDMGWEICPDGLDWLIRRTVTDYTGDLPLFITENGMANADQVAVPDLARIDYLDRHLERMKTMVEDGIPLKGYTIWSLLDNYEWTLGYDKRFGLVHVDFDDYTRTPKASYHAVQRALAA